MFGALGVKKKFAKGGGTFLPTRKSSTRSCREKLFSPGKNARGPLLPRASHSFSLLFHRRSSLVVALFLSLSPTSVSLSLTVYLRLGSPFSPRLTVLRAAAAAAAAACGSLEACTCARSSRSPLVELDKETTQQRVRVLEPRATFSIRTRPRDRSERARLREDRETP